MQVSLEILDNLERKLTVKLPSDKLDSQIAERVARMGREVRLKGFRPGKVPHAVIEKRYGAQIRGEALGDLIRSSFSEAVEQQHLKPVAAPSINTSGTPQDGEISYTATFEVMPPLPTVDAKALKIERPVAEVSEGDVDEMIETLRQQRRSFVPSEQPAATGDMALFEFSATTSDGRFPLEGVERIGTILGSGSLPEALESALVGKSPDDTLELEVNFPAGFRIAELAGKLAQLNVKMVRVQSPELPAVDDAFVQAFGIADGDIQTFRKEVRGNLERELSAALMARLKAEVAGKLAAAHKDIELPKVMVAAEARGLARVPANQPLSQERFDALAPVARDRVIAALLFGEIARNNDLRVDDKRVAQALAVIASTYEEPEQVVELYRNDPQLMGALRTRVLEEQVAEWVASEADTSDHSMSFNEVLRPTA
ncbi:MAG TPA: trigger factor [Rhodanobacteraceae bacterium]|nr:trigger factor [Rhodanobacteraceae bacterium]